MQTISNPAGATGGADDNPLENDTIWMPDASQLHFTNELLVDDWGRQMQLPSGLITQVCRKCKTHTTRVRELSSQMRRAIRPHLSQAAIKDRSPHTAGRGPCLCRDCGEAVRLGVRR